MTAEEVKASLLNATHTGRVVTVKAQTGATVTDTLLSVFHWTILGFDGESTGDARTCIQFAKTIPAHNLNWNHPDFLNSFFEVDGEAVATVEAVTS